MMTMTRSSFAPSRYQQAIFEAVQQGCKALVVSAVPGSGKTTTSKELIRYLPADATVLALAFNVDAAAQLQKKINEMLKSMQAEGLATPIVDSRTIHSLGNATLVAANLKSSVKPTKYTKLCREYLKMRNVQNPNTVQHLSKLIDMTRLTLSGIDERSLKWLCNRFEIDLDFSDDEVWPIILQAVPYLLDEGIEQCQEDRIIDYTDMIWLPYVLKLQPRRYDYVLVDEAQDLSPAQRALVLKARKKDSAFIAVGDKNQAIYGFAGASLRSIDEIIDATGAIELPLSICYRCPQKVVDLAASIYPGIEAAPNQVEGTVEYILPDAVTNCTRPGDLILCRLTAPLVEECLRLLRMGKRANVRGKDLGKSFISLLEQVEKFSRGQLTMLSLETCVQNYARKQFEALGRHAEENEMKISSLEDKITTLLVLHEAYIAQTEREDRTLDGFINYITAFFAEDKGAQIILSTGHRAKGLEYPRVFILGSDKLPHPRAKTPEAIIQEYNLMYVMYTRTHYDQHIDGSGTLFLVMDRLPLVVPQLPSEEVQQPEETLMATKHAGGRPRKDRVRVNIKLDSDLAERTKEGDRSELINMLLRKHFDEQE